MATNIERPIIAGTPLVGQRLTTRSGVWTGLTASSVFTWKWELDGVALPFTSWECTPSKAGWLKLTVTADGTAASSDLVPIKVQASDPNPPLPNQPPTPPPPTSVNLTDAQKKTITNYVTTLGGWKTTLTKMLQVKSPTQLTAVLMEIEAVRTRLRGIIAATSPTSDTTPNAFTFTDVTNATLSTQYTSNTITVAGIDAASPISISGGTYSKNGGGYTSSSGTVVNGDTVSVRVTSSGSNSTAVSATLTIGGVSDVYSVTTEASGGGDFDEWSELPRSTPNSTLETSFANTYNVTSGNSSDLQTKINTARSTAGNSVVNIPVATYDLPSGLNIPAPTNGAGTILIRSANHASLPAAGTRIIPGTHGANMPTLRMVTNNNQTIEVPINSDNVQFHGLNITQSGVDCTHLMYFGSDFESSSGDNQPNNIIVAQCYLHGEAYPTLLTNTLGRNIRGEGRNIAIVDSYLSDCAAPGTDTQNFNCTNTPGPILIENCYLAAGAENIMFGGGDPQITNVTPSDITIRGNHFDKDPNWFGNTATVKNSFETKFGVRVLVENNVFTRLPVEQQDGQFFNINNLTQGGGALWTTTQDITIRNNVCYNGVGFIVLNCNQQNAGQYTVPGARYSVHDNVCFDIGTYNGTTLAYWFQILGTAESGEHMDKVSIKNNTIVSNAETSGRAFNLDVGTSTNLVVTDNVLSAGHYFVFGSGAGSGMNAFDVFWPGSHNVSGNIIINEQNGDSYPGNTKVASIAAVGFDNPAADDYRITGTHAGKGADWDAVRNATFGVVTAGAYVLA